MRYVSFRKPDGTAAYGRLHGQIVRELTGAADLAGALASGSLASLADGAAYPAAEVELLPVIPNPGKIFCIGLNYATHISEMGRQRMEHPAVFTRWAHTLVAHGQPLVRPRESHRFDYEGELAVIIGRAGRRIPREAVAEHIAGYSIFHDGSVRDWQAHNSQFTPGKNFPATGGFGPALVTPDEIEDLPAQRVQTRLNGVLVQDQPIADMLCDVAGIVSYVSSFCPLRPGDVIATGTPGGVGDKREPPLYMKGGDVVEVSIGTIGTLVNPVVDEG